MKLSIIIVNYNVKHFLEQCLDSVFLAIKNIETEIFVVDNNSTDGSTDYLKPLFSDVIFIENKENIGFSKANNQAISQAKGDYVLLLNPDTVIGENSLMNVCSFMDDNTNAGAVGVKMIDGYGRFLPESKRGFPSPWNSFCKMSGLSKLFPNSKRFGRYHLKYLDKNFVHQVDILAGAFMMVRRKAFEIAGYLDENFFMYGEDIDLSFKITRTGYKNYYFPEPIIHYKGESTKKDIKYVKHFYEAMLIFFKKYYPHSNMSFKLLIRLAIVFCGTISAVQKIFKPFKNIFSLQKKDKEYVFDKSINTYEQIIHSIDQHSGEKTRFKIYHPEKGITISSNQITMKNT